MRCSIFIASSTSSSWPACTRSPTATFTDSTLPGTAAGAASYSVLGGCDENIESLGTATTELRLYGGCLTPAGAVDVLAYARDPNGVRLAYSHALDVRPHMKHAGGYLVQSVS